MKSLTLSFIFAFFVFNSNCQETQNLTLGYMIEYALHNNPEIISMGKKVESLKTLPAQESALQDPQLSFEVMNLRLSNPHLNEVLNKGVTIGITQELPYPGVRKLKKELSVTEAKIEEKRVKAIKAQVISEIKENYYDLKYILSVLEILEKKEETLKSVVDSLIARYETGSGIMADILKGKTEIEEIKKRKVELLKLQEIITSRLFTLMGLPFKDNCRIVFVEEEPFSLPDLDKFLNLVDSSPFVEIGNLRKEQANNRVMLAKKNFKPNFMVGGFYRFKDMTMGEKDYLSVMFQVSLPLFHKKDKYSQALSEAVFMRESTDYEIKDILLETKFKIKKNYEEAKSAFRSYELIKENLIPLSEETVKSLAASYIVSQADFEYYIQSIIKFYEYQEEKEAASSQFHKAISKIEEILGEELIDFFNPKENGN